MNKSRLKRPLNIVADANMPHIEQLFGDFAQLTRLDGRAIRSQHLASADALLCRSITQVNGELLQHTPVQFVGTATIGIDHLQTEWLDQQGIAWTNAAGCNAAAVAQYVLSAMAFWLKQQQRQLSDICVGIVGAGHVGSQLSRYLELLNVRYLLCDPPLARQGDTRQFASLDALSECDVITLHVPITREGMDATWHLIDSKFLARLKPSQLLINAARGSVVDNNALDVYLQSENHAQCVLDVFENEPRINLSLARRCLLATPHIAGHTLEGKSRGSFMIYQALCRHFGISETVTEAELYPALNQLEQHQRIADERDALLAIYDICRDSARLLAASESTIAVHFDQLRKDYASFFQPQPRRDYAGWQASTEFPANIRRLLGG